MALLAIILIMLSLPKVILDDSKKRLGRYSWGWALFSGVNLFLCLPQIFKTMNSPAAASSNTQWWILGSLAGAWFASFSIYRVFTPTPKTDK